MNERSKELFAVLVGVSLCASVFGYAVYQVYWSHREYTVEFKVFEANHWSVKGKSETQILTWGNSLYGKYYFLGNWTGQFLMDHTYRVTYVQQSGHAKHVWNNLIVLNWEEIQ